VKDGEIVFAAAEERYTRVKQDSSFPVQGIEAGFREICIKDNDVDVVSLSWPLDYSSVWHDFRLIMSGDFKATRSRLKKTTAKFLSAIAQRKKIKKRYERQFCSPRKGYVFSDHHKAHAWSAFYLSDVERPVCVVFDGRGTSEATSFWKVNKKGDLEKLFERK